METMLSIFGAPLTRYGLMAGLALALTLAAALYRCLRRKVPYAAFIRMAVLSAPLAWLCSRIVFAAVNYNYYLVEIGNPALALHFWDGGYSMTGAYLGLVLAAAIGAKWAHQPVGPLMDALGLGMPLGLMVARLAEYGTGIGEGREVPENWPAVFSVDTEYGLLHAICRYEALAALVILVVLLVWLHLDRKRRDGDILLMFTLLFGCAQVVLESLREDGHMTVHMGVSVQQVIAAVMIAAVLVIWLIRAIKAGRVKPWQAVLISLIAVAAISLAVIAEFGVDRWDSKLLAYSIMVACIAALFILADLCRRLAAHPKQ